MAAFEDFVWHQTKDANGNPILYALDDKTQTVFFMPAVHPLTECEAAKQLDEMVERHQAKQRAPDK